MPKKKTAAHRLAALAVALIALSPPETSARSNAARHQFARHQPCPNTTENRLPCPGYVIDHITPLCLGGADTPANMQWQTRAESLRKDIDERRACRLIKQPN